MDLTFRSTKDAEEADGNIAVASSGRRAHLFLPTWSSPLEVLMVVAIVLLLHRLLVKFAYQVLVQLLLVAALFKLPLPATLYLAGNF